MLWLLHPVTQVYGGAIERVVVNHPSGDKGTVGEFLKTQNLISPNINYDLAQLANNGDNTPLILCVQICLPANVSQEMIQQAMNDPRGQGGQNRKAKERDSAGFEELGDDALGTGVDTMFGQGMNEKRYTTIHADGKEYDQDGNEIK